LFYDAACAPSPGLVDPLHMGAHKDMDFFTFGRSAATLGHSFGRLAEAGLRHEGAPAELLPVLRRIGRDAEAAMFYATNGVNTHKGIIFSFGIALAATGILIRDKSRIAAETLSECVKKLTKGLVEMDLSPPRRTDLTVTAGEEMYRRFGMAGVRGEAQAGFPSVLKTGLPTLRRALADRYDTNKALLKTLLALMSVVDDTTILYRGYGLEALTWLKRAAEEYLQGDFFARGDWQEQLWLLDRELLRRNLSPGGSADLLALTWYFYNIEDRL
jgi:holo-ACP synthase/triphosphoribosyl-dephospho-CoA synthase